MYIIAMNTMIYAAAATIRPSALWMAVAHVHALQLASVVSVSVMPESVSLSVSQSAFQVASVVS